MVIAFETRRLREICEIDTEARNRLKSTVAESLQRRLADIDAAATAGDLIAGQPHLAPNRRSMIIHLASGYRLVIAPNNLRGLKHQSAEVEWQQVNRIKILRIESDHDLI